MDKPNQLYPLKFGPEAGFRTMLSASSAAKKMTPQTNATKSLKRFFFIALNSSH
jgi:hypothetical protein